MRRFISRRPTRFATAAALCVALAVPAAGSAMPAPDTPTGTAPQQQPAAIHPETTPVTENGSATLALVLSSAAVLVAGASAAQSARLGVRLRRTR